jgi:hypothetical protein
MTTTVTNATIEELLEAVFSVWSMPRIYKKNQLPLEENSGHPCGGEVEYLHRDPVSRRRRRKGKLLGDD